MEYEILFWFAFCFCLFVCLFVCFVLFCSVLFCSVLLIMKGKAYYIQFQVHSTNIFGLGVKANYIARWQPPSLTLTLAAYPTITEDMVVCLFS